MCSYSQLTNLNGKGSLSEAWLSFEGSHAHCLNDLSTHFQVFHMVYKAFYDSKWFLRKL